MDNSSKHVRALDGVRGLALLIVMFAHTTPQVFPGGNIGVDLFFTLSGFLITSLLLAEQRSYGRISVGWFYLRRALRLFPALALVVCAIVAYASVYEPSILPATLDNATWVAAYLWNWVLAFNFNDRPAWTFQTMFSHLWSLSVEEQFYILWPWVLVAALSFRSKWFIGMILAAGIVLPAIGRLAMFKAGPSMDIYFRTDLRFDNLMWGAAAAFLFAYRRDLPDARRVKLALAIGGTFGLVAFLCLARVNLISNGVLYQGGLTGIGALGAIIILAGASNAWAPLTKVLQFRPLTYTGDISYGLYLWHVPAFHLALQLPVGDLERNAVAIVGTYAVATASFYLMEKPIRSLRRYIPKTTRRLSVPPALTVEPS